MKASPIVSRELELPPPLDGDLRATAPPLLPLPLLLLVPPLRDEPLLVAFLAILFSNYR
jgi:hypothetical protein